MPIETLTVSETEGPTITVAGLVTCIPANNRITLPPGFFFIGRALHFRLSGRMSVAAITPGTPRFTIQMGAAGATIVFDTSTFTANAAGKVDVPWVFDCLLVCRAVGSGTSTTFFPTAYFASEAVIGAPLSAVGGNGVLYLPVGAPAVGAGTNSVGENIVDVLFNLSVATGSFTCTHYRLDLIR